MSDKKSLRILVCGGRDFSDWKLVWKTLSPYVRKGPMVIIHGGARGADEMGGNFARLWSLEEVVFLADWKTHGKAAGPLRNQQMLDEGKPDLVVAFPGGRGTADMVSRARKAGVKVKIIDA